MFNKVIVRVMLIVLSFMMMLATVFAETPAQEAEKNNALPVINNIGFMKNSPKELKERFPMCDAFLKVEWIDKKKKIGYSRYELYRDGIKQKQKAFALVHLDKSYPQFEYDLSVFDGEKKIGIKEVFSIIKKGKVYIPDTALTILYDNRKKSLDFHTRNTWDLTLADNRLTVGIPYPDNQKVWIAEGKQINKLYNEEEAVKLYKKTNMRGPNPEAIILDLNFDGKEDYFNGVSIIYSYGNEYYEMTPLWENDFDDKSDQWSFPPSQKICAPKWLKGPLFITSDGKSYFLNNQCNLTELTKGEE